MNQSESNPTNSGADRPVSPSKIDPNLWLDEHGDYLYRFAVSRLRDGESAEEVVQDTFVSALKNVHQFAGRGSERAWLLGILKRKVIDVFRKRKRDPINISEESTDISDRLFDQKGSWKKELRTIVKQSLDSLDREEFWGMLKNCLNRLPQRQADAFTMRTMDERTTEEVCKELDITSTNYWVILHRARMQLSSCVKQRWFNEGKQS
ncbi:MAG: sigma-70 family RNA polymerase sigma factor [Mariniblastus sp.]